MPTPSVLCGACGVAWRDRVPYLDTVAAELFGSVERHIGLMNQISLLALAARLDRLDPVVAVIEPDPDSVEVYRSLRRRMDHVAHSVLAATASALGSEARAS